MSTMTSTEQISGTAVASNDAVPGKIATSKEELERQKLQLEIETLSHPWLQPQTWLGGVTLLLAVIGALVTVKYQSSTAELKITKAEIDTKAALLAVENAKHEQHRAETERDAAITQRDAANVQAAVAQSRVTASALEESNNRERAARAMELIEQAKKWAEDGEQKVELPKEVHKLLADLKELVYTETAKVVAAGTQKDEDGSPWQIVEFLSQTQGTKVHYETIGRRASPMLRARVGGIERVPSHLISFNTTPFKAELRPGYYEVLFMLPSGKRFQTSFIVPWIGMDPQNPLAY